VQESPKLTDRQQQILDLVQSAIERTGAPPTRAEIANELGFKSANAAEEHSGRWRERRDWSAASRAFASSRHLRARAQPGARAPVQPASRVRKLPLARRVRGVIWRRA
jgi:SOS-response transcriptional repressor LexA